MWRLELEDGLVVCPPLGGVACRGRADPAFAPNTLFCSQTFRRGSWTFGLFASCP